MKFCNLVPGLNKFQVPGLKFKVGTWNIESETLNIKH
jgi:hypothetical protein